MYKKQNLIIVTALYSWIWIVMIFIISHLLHENPINVAELKRFVFSLGYSKLLFEDMFRFLVEVIAILLIIYIFSLLYYLATSVGNELFVGYYFYRLKNRFQQVVKNKKVVLFTTLFFIFAITGAYFLFLTLCWIATIYLLLKNIFIIENIPLEMLSNKKNKLVSLKINQSINYKFIMQYMSSLIIVITLYSISNLIWVHFAFYQIILYSTIVLFYALIMEINQIIKADSAYAKEEKERAVNHYIINKIWSDPAPEMWPSSKKAFENILSMNHFNLKKRQEFIAAMETTGYSYKFIQLLLNRYNQIVIEYKETSKLQAEVIVLRNNKNLLVAFIFIISLGFITFINETVYITAVFRNVLLNVFFWMVFFRLILRSSEIAYSFYKDIKPDFKIKNTNIDNGERISLVLKSWLEVILLCSVIYTLIYILIEDNVLNWVEYFYTALSHAIATATFNSSFPYDTMSSIELSSLSYLKFPYLEFWNWLTIIQVVHLIQLITSIVLISLSIASYGSKAQVETFYNISFSEGKYRLVKIERKREKSRKLFESDNIDDLIRCIDDDWSNSKTSQFNASQYLKIIDLIDSSLLKQ